MAIGSTAPLRYHSCFQNGTDSVVIKSNPGTPVAICSSSISAVPPRLRKSVIGRGRLIVANWPGPHFKFRTARRTYQLQHILAKIDFKAVSALSIGLVVEISNSDACVHCRASTPSID